MRGFPDRGGSSTWPYETSRKASGRLDRIRDDGVLEASMTLGDGFRGAPTFTGSGEFVGMVCETGEWSCRILPAASSSSPSAPETCAAVACSWLR